MTTNHPKASKPDIVIPEEASGRGPILSGELRSTHHRYPDMLVQFERIAPADRKARIFLLPTVEQAKRLYHEPQGPFTFEGTFRIQQDVMETRLAEDIWLKPPSQIYHAEANYWSQTSGRIGTLHTTIRYSPGSRFDSRQDDHSAWFIARRCFLLQILANMDEEDAVNAAKYGFSKPDVSIALSDGATATVRRYTKSSRQGVTREITRSGYAIAVDRYKDAVDVKKDVDALLILASFASRKRTVSSFWSYETKDETQQAWQFNFGKFPQRREREEPVVRRDREEAHEFLQRAFNIYTNAKHQPLLDSAIYALLDHDLSLETSIARLFSGIQGALVFANQSPMTGKRPLIGALFRTFSSAHPGAFDDLWPLIDPRTGPPLSNFRNAIVHGETFSESDWLALSYAGEHLRWYLERIILIALGWDVEKSSVSPGTVRRSYAHMKWREEQRKLAHRTATP